MAGSKPGERRGGRKAGTPNKRTAERETAMADAAAKIEAALGEAFPGDAHEFLVTLYKDLSQPVEVRLDAAKAAVRYERPALAAIDMKATNENIVYQVSDTPMTMDEWEARHCGGKPQH